MRELKYAPEAWKCLNGIFCIYKPSDLFWMFSRKTLAFNICRDLNEMEKRPQREFVMLKGSVSSGKPFSVELTPNFADHELVSGARYQPHDVRLDCISKMGKYSSGVLFAVNDGCKEVKTLKSRNFLRKYEVKGKFGCASDTFMADGKIREHSTFSHIKQSRFDFLLASIQSSHQALAYKYSGVDLQSQEAYEMASKGLVRPYGCTDPVIYGIRCTEFNLPHFTLEIQCINESEVFLAELVHQLGIDMKSTAVCIQLRRTQYGHFTLEHALLKKHWTLEHILNNVTLCTKVLKDEISSTSPVHFSIIQTSKLKEIEENMRQEAREDAL